MKMNKLLWKEKIDFDSIVAFLGPGVAKVIPFKLRYK